MFFRANNKDEHSRTLLSIMSDIAFGAQRAKSDEPEAPETWDAVDAERSTVPQRTLADILAALRAGERSADEVRLEVIHSPAAPVVGSSAPVEPHQPQEPPVIDSLAPTPAPVSAAVPEPPTVVEPEANTPIEGLEEFEDAQRRASTHRQAIQALLDEARKVEEKIAAEAAEARATRERLRLQEKIAIAARAAERELQAIARATETSQRAERMAAENAQAAEALRAAHNEALSAAAAVAECEIRLQQAQKIAGESERLLREIEERAQRVAVLAREAQREAEEAERQVVECRATREAGETEARNAQAVADSLAPSAEALEGLRSLESRVADHHAANEG